MKKGLIPATLLAMLALLATGCGVNVNPGTSSQEPSSSQTSESGSQGDSESGSQGGSESSSEGGSSESSGGQGGSESSGGQGGSESQSGGSESSSEGGSSESSSGESSSSEEVQVDYGSETSPLTPEQLFTEVAKLTSLGNKDYSPNYFYVKGALKEIVSGSTATSGKYVLYAGSGTLETSSTKVGTGVEFDNIYPNDTLLIRGYVRKDSSKPGGYYISYNQSAPEADQAPVVLSRVAGDATLNKDIGEHVDVSFTQNSFKNGDLVEFTVTPATGYVVSEVSLDGTALTLVEGKYSFTIHGTMTLKVRAADASKYATSVVISGESTVETYSTLKLSAVVEGDDGVSQAVVWSITSGSDYASVEDGVVTPIAAGEVVVRATAVATDSSGAPVYDEKTITVTAKHGTTADDPLSLAEAVALGQALEDKANTEIEYYFGGYVDQIVSAWDSNYGNLTVWITDGENRFECYRTLADQEKGESIELGSQLLIKGQIKRFGSTIETVEKQSNLISVDNSKFTFVKISGDESVKAGESISLTATAYPVSLGAATFTWNTSDATVATVADGVVEGVGEGAATITATSGSLSATYSVQVTDPSILNATLKYSNTSTTTNMRDDTDEAATLGLASDVFSAYGYKNGSNNNVGLNKAPHIALYSVKNQKYGCYLTVSAKEGYGISKIVVDYKLNDSYAEVFEGAVSVTDTVLSGTSVAGEDGVYTFSSLKQSFTIANAFESSSTSAQVQINKIDIYYKDLVDKAGTAEELVNAIKNDATIKLTDDITVGDSFVTALENADNVDLDLNGHTLNVDSSDTIELSGQTIRISNGELVSSAAQSATSTLIWTEANTTLSLQNLDIESNGVPLQIRGDTTEVDINECIIIGNTYAVSSNANEGGSTPIVNITDSELLARGWGYDATTEETDGDGAGLLFNIQAQVTVSNTTIEGGRQGAIIRGGTATFLNSTIKNNGTWVAKGNSASKYTSTNWGSGNELPTAALVVGNVHSSSYQYDSNVTFDSKTNLVSTNSDLPLLYVGGTFASAGAYKASVTLSTPAVFTTTECVQQGSDIELTGITVSDPAPDAHAITNSLEHCESITGITEYINDGEALEFEIEPSEGYKFKDAEDITVTMGGVTQETSLDSTTGKISVSIASVTGDVVISGAPSKVYITDTLNRGKTGITGTSYADWENVTDLSNAVYKGQSAGGNDSIQLRSSNSNSGIVCTVSGGVAAKIIVTWQSSTSNERTLDIYGKNTAYSAATDLYGSSQGTKIGSIVCGTSTELTISGNYTYIGLRSNNGAMYITSIQIVWLADVA